jgi:AraC-like DNA-binding protein
MRVAVAKDMLEDGARSLRAVSAAVGYRDAAFFRAVFKRSTGMTPGEYRENFVGVSCVNPHAPSKRSRIGSNGAEASSRSVGRPPRAIFVPERARSRT